VQSRRLFELLKPPRGFRLTKAGRVFFAFLTCLIVISLATGNNLIFLVLAAMLGFMVVSGVQSEVNLRYIELERLMPAEIHAGVPARVGYAVRNMRTSSERLVLSDLSRVRIPFLARKEELVLHSEVTFARRGKVLLGDIKVFTTYPYGLFVKSITFEAACSVLVFPRPLPLIRAGFKGLTDSGAGPVRETVSHLRPYVSGDPLSAVAWKKMQTGPVSRVFEGGTGAGGVIVLTPGEDMETKLSHAAYLVDRFYESSRPFGVLVSSSFSGLGCTRAHRQEALAMLALVETIQQPRYEAVPQDADVILI
jgi:uncharacterized protein (DUF58 family)